MAEVWPAHVKAWRAKLALLAPDGPLRLSRDERSELAAILEAAPAAIGRIAAAEPCTLGCVRCDLLRRVSAARALAFLEEHWEEWARKGAASGHGDCQGDEVDRLKLAAARIERGRQQWEGLSVVGRARLKQQLEAAGGVHGRYLTILGK